MLLILRNSPDISRSYENFVFPTSFFHESGRLYIAAILCLGLVVRLATLNRDSLWLDEIISATFSAQPFSELILLSGWIDFHPPLYFLQLKVWAFVSQDDFGFV